MRSLLKFLKERHIGTLLAGGLAWLAIPTAGAQVVQPMGSFGQQRNPRRMQDASSQQESYPQQQQPSAQQQQAGPAPAMGQATGQGQEVSQSAVPPSLLDKPAQPAKVDLAAGQLTVHADNSSLLEIMHLLTTDAGMSIDGLNKDQRVFGTYGPGDPQQVISDLLDGTGYNVVMLGRTEAGTPKQVTLTPRAGGVSNGPAGIRPQPMNQDDDVEDEPPQPIIANPVVEPPQQQPPQAPGGVRTPQQMLQDLQQMRQRQMEQMQQNQGQPQPPQPQ